MFAAICDGVLPAEFFPGMGGNKADKRTRRKRKTNGGNEQQP